MSISKVPYGQVDSKDVYLFTLTNASGMSVKAISLGCHIMQINVPDKDGKFADVVLSFDSLEAAENQCSCFGVVVGRVANRIARSRFELDGKVYELYANEGPNHLHGGKIGFHKKVWDAQALEDKNAVVFRYVSPDGEENYPGSLSAQVTYTLTDNNELIMDYEAVSDADTIVNLTNHSYFNLAGHDAGPIVDHYLKLNCDTFTACDSELIPTGVIADVAGTPLDFRSFERVGDRIDDNNDQLVWAKGYDHNFVINNQSGMTLAASLWDKKTGRLMEVLTDKPAIQFYSGNFLHGADVGKGGCAYQKRDGLCLETQHYPNAINTPNFPSPVLRAEDKYKYATIYRFGTMTEG